MTRQGAWSQHTQAGIHSKGNMALILAIKVVHLVDSTTIVVIMQTGPNSRDKPSRGTNNINTFMGRMDRDSLGIVAMDSNPTKIGRRINSMIATISSRNTSMISTLGAIIKANRIMIIQEVVQAEACRETTMHSNTSTSFWAL